MTNTRPHHESEPPRTLQLVPVAGRLNLQDSPEDYTPGLNVTASLQDSREKSHHSMCQVLLDFSGILLNASLIMQRLLESVCTADIMWTKPRWLTFISSAITKPWRYVCSYFPSTKSSSHTPLLPFSRQSPRYTLIGLALTVFDGIPNMPALSTQRRRRQTLHRIHRTWTLLLQYQTMKQDLSMFQTADDLNRVGSSSYRQRAFYFPPFFGSAFKSRLPSPLFRYILPHGAHALDN